MRAANIPKLCLMGGTENMRAAEQVRAFAAGFPDRMDWLESLPRGFAALSVGALCSALGHDGGEPELLSMRLCIYMVDRPHESCGHLGTGARHHLDGESRCRSACGTVAGRMRGRVDSLAASACQYGPGPESDALRDSAFQPGDAFDWRSRLQSYADQYGLVPHPNELWRWGLMPGSPGDPGVPGGS